MRQDLFVFAVIAAHPKIIVVAHSLLLKRFETSILSFDGSEHDVVRDLSPMGGAMEPGEERDAREEMPEERDAMIEFIKWLNLRLKVLGTLLSSKSTHFSWSPREGISRLINSISRPGWELTRKHINVKLMHN